MRIGRYFVTGCCKFSRFLLVIDMISEWARYLVTMHIMCNNSVLLIYQLAISDDSGKGPQHGSSKCKVRITGCGKLTIYLTQAREHSLW
jgi:hypothetical protein